MNGLLRQSQLFIKRNGSTILTCIGGAGVIATSVMAVKATPKALEKIKMAEEEKGEELTKIEKVQVAGTTYIPTMLMGAGSIACIFGANALNKRQQAALISAYALLDNTYKQYKNKVVELYGEEAHQNIMDSIVIEQANDVTVHAALFCDDCVLTDDEACGEPVLFYDEHSKRFFNATIEQVIAAQYHLNRNFVLRGYVWLNEMYDFLGLEPTEFGDVMGWAVNDDCIYWIDFNQRKVILDDGLECYIIDTPYGPSYEPWNE